MIEDSYLAEIQQMYTDLKAKGTPKALSMMNELVAFNQTIQVFFDVRSEQWCLWVCF
jgi:hypothetical protein